jgi:hypothetical protein
MTINDGIEWWRNEQIRLQFRLRSGSFKHNQNLAADHVLWQTPGLPVLDGGRTFGPPPPKIVYGGAKAQKRAYYTELRWKRCQARDKWRGRIFIFIWNCHGASVFQRLRPHISSYHDRYSKCVAKCKEAAWRTMQSNRDCGAVAKLISRWQWEFKGAVRRQFRLRM